MARVESYLKGFAINKSDITSVAVSIRDRDGAWVLKINPTSIELSQVN
jgi:hypothetical protein